MPPKSYLYKLWIKLTGDPAQFPLHARIFHSVCLISIVALGYNVPFNYFIGLPDIALASMVVLLITGTLYYMSRWKGLTRASTIMINVISLGLFMFNYFLNSGQQGPTDLFFLLMMLISMGVNPVNEYRFWITLNIGVFLLLNLYEFLSPDAIPFTYKSRFSRFVDHMSAYAVVAAMASFCIYFIRKAYENEKNAVAEKSQAIESQNEQIIKQNQELEKLNAEKNKLMSIVAHDLRSPLGSIQNFLELLTQHELEEDQKRDIENELLNTTKNTMTMLTKLLEWSKSQLHGVVARLENLNLGKLLEPVLYLEQNVAARKNIELKFVFDPTIVVYADSDMMQLILRNLVGNAIKFTKSGGQITISANISDGYCIIKVEDNGIGVSAAKQEAIFSLNVQSTYGTKNEKGVGLGLLLCIEFIKAQNGRIWFESFEGEGTSFYAAIPAGDAANLASA